MEKIIPINKNQKHILVPVLNFQISKTTSTGYAKFDSPLQYSICTRYLFTY